MAYFFEWRIIMESFDKKLEELSVMFSSALKEFNEEIEILTDVPKTIYASNCAA